jgi:O-Antigen ligase
MAGGAETFRYLPAGNGHVPRARLAGDLLIALGAMLIAATVPLIALRALSLRPGSFPFLAAAVVLAVFLIRQPRWIIPSYIALVWTSIEQGYLGGLPSPIEAGAYVLIFFATWEAIRRFDYAREVLLVCVALALPLAIAGLLSVDGALIPTDALKNVMYLFIVALVVRTVDEVDKTMTTLSVVGIVLGLGALYSVFVAPLPLFPLKSLSAPGFQVTELRAAGPVGDPNFFALVMAALVPMGLFLIAKGGKSALLGAASVGCLIGGIFATGSRGGTIATGFAILGMAAVVPAPRLRAGAAVMILAAILALPLFASQSQGAEARGVGGRLTENRIAVAMFEDHPITGVGPGQYTILYRDYGREIGNDPRVLREPHSLPLEIASEQGIAGLVGWALAGVVAFGFAFSRGIWRLVVGRALVMAIATFLVGSLFLHGSQIRLLYVLIGLLLALAAAMPRAPDRSSAPA